MVSLPRLANLLVSEEAVTSMMDEGHTVDVIFLDFAKAFDSVNHRFLLAKMKSFSLGDDFVRWIEAYLSGWVSRVHVGGEYSGAIPMHSGDRPTAVSPFRARPPRCPRSTGVALCE